MRQAALIWTWKPWEQATGPRTAEGKESSSRNGFKGGLWRELRKLSKSMNSVLREQREELRRVAG